MPSGTKTVQLLSSASQHQEIASICHIAADLDAKLLAYKQGHPATVLLDPPAAVRAVQDRVCMLAPLTDKQLILTLQQQPQQLEQPLQTQMPRHNEHQTVSISAPTQVTFPSGCSADEALQWLATAGLTYPALVKPLITAPPDSCAAAAAATAPGLLVSNANHSSRDGHALGALLSAEGVQQLVAGECDPTLQLPIVVQQFVPHGEALYKVGQQVEGNSPCCRSAVECRVLHLHISCTDSRCLASLLWSAVSSDSDMSHVLVHPPCCYLVPA